MWAERVREWRASGLSADLFAEGKGYKPASLRWAESWLSRGADGGRRPRGRPPKSALAKTPVGTAMPSTTPRFVPLLARSPSTDGGVVVEVGSACIRVTAGFDLALLREVVRALGEGAR